MPDTVVSGNKNIPAGTRLVQASDGDQRLTAGENAAVIAIQREDTTKRIVSFELDAAKPRLNIYAPSVEIPAVEHLASKHLPPTRFAVKESRYSNAELQTEVTRILSTQQQVTATSRITTIGPKSDGSGLDIQINVPVMTGLSLPEAPQIQSRIPVSLSVGGEVSNAATRYADTPPLHFRSLYGGKSQECMLYASHAGSHRLHAFGRPLQRDGRQMDLRNRRATWSNARVPWHRCRSGQKRQ